MTDRTVTYRLRAELGQWNASMAQASASTKKLAGDLTSMDRAAVKQRQSLATIGSGAAKVGLVAAAGIGAIVVASANFEQKMSGVQAATRETAGNMDLLREAAIKAGAETAFSAGEAADGITELAKAGLSTQDILNGGLNGALSLAAAGQIEVGQAAEFAAKAMTQFNLSGDQVPHVADLLASAAGKAVGEVGDFGAALNQTGLVANQMGLTIEDTVGTLAAFSQAGLSGSDAGTAFKSMLQRLQNPLGQGAKAMEQFGINAYDTQGNFVGITDVADQLQTKLKGVDQATRDAALAQILGSDAIRGATVLYEEGASGIQRWINQTNDAGFAAEQAATKLDNLKGDLEALGGSLETALIGSGSGSQGMLRDLTQGLTGAVNKFNELPPSAQQATTSLLGITAVTSGALWFGTKVIQGVSNTREALSSLGTTGARTGRVLRSALTGVAIVEGLNLLDQAIDQVFDRDLDASNLGRSLEALSSGEIAGELEKVFGQDLEGFGDAMDRVTSNWTAISRLSDKIPVVGDFIAGDVSDDLANIEKIDETLAGWVESGRAEEAGMAFDFLVSKAKEAGFGVEQVSEQFDQYSLALNNAGLATSTAGVILAPFAAVQNGIVAATQQLTGVTDQNSDGIVDNTDAIRQNIAAMEEQRSQRLAAANAEIAYQAALDDAKAALKENGKTLDITTEKGRNNKTALLNTAAAWNDLSARQQNAKGAFASARQSLIQQAQQFGATRAQAERYADKLLDIPPRVTTNVEANTAGAQAKISAFQQAINNLRDKQVTITTVYNEVHRNRAVSVGIAPEKKATGGLITGPGTAMSDSIPAMLSTGEYVMRAAAVDRYGVDMMHRMNALRFAEGGMVPSPVSAPSASTQRVTFDPARVTIATPWGNQDVVLIARQAARAEIDSDADFHGRLSRR